MVSPKRMIADPTRKMVMVWPNPQSIPITAPCFTDLSRLTIVETATT